MESWEKNYIRNYEDETEDKQPVSTAVRDDGATWLLAGVCLLLLSNSRKQLVSALLRYNPFIFLSSATNVINEIQS